VPITIEWSLIDCPDSNVMQKGSVLSRLGKEILLIGM